ncbi:hypothetical protein [Streptomyces sp. BH105]|uniref:hypothetical protein n=1 Tax=Streptomyces sp. BH105 TaxID=3410408 RepID=UPI003CF4CDE3
MKIQRDATGRIHLDTGSGKGPGGYDPNNLPEGFEQEYEAMCDRYAGSLIAAEYRNRIMRGHL